MDKLRTPNAELIQTSTRPTIGWRALVNHTFVFIYMREFGYILYFVRSMSKPGKLLWNY